MLRSYLHFAASLILFLGTKSKLQAQSIDPAKGPVITEPPTDDLNYRLMGEFIGEIKTDVDEAQKLGLQLRPVGNDLFDAVSFLGGLPGQENHQSQPMRMIGRRSDDFLLLSGGPWAIFVEQESCTIIDRKGDKIGRLERISRSSPTLGARAPRTQPFCSTEPAPTNLSKQK